MNRNDQESSVSKLRSDATQLMSAAARQPAAAHLYEQAGRLLRLAERLERR